MSIPTTQKFTEGYRSLFVTAGWIDVNNGLDITSADYNSGYDIFGFDTSPPICHGEEIEIDLCKRI